MRFDTILAFSLLAAAAAASLSLASVISPEVEAHFRQKSAEPISLFISFQQDIMSVIEKINSQQFSSIVAKRTALTNAQIRFSNEAQANLRDYLERKEIPHESYWISNNILIPNATISLVRNLDRKSDLNGISKIDKEPQSIYTTSTVETVARFVGPTLQKSSQVHWQLEKIRAPEAWALGYTGKGIVVANIDSGVRGNHETLKNNWRGEYGWYDARREYLNAPMESSNDNHGTPAMGLMAGSHGIGVAPEATWIACRYFCSMSKTKIWRVK